MSLLLVKRSIFTKILVSLLFATIIPFLLSNYISYQITGKAVNDQLVELNQNSMAITVSSLHEYFHDLSMLGLAYYGDPTLTRILSSETLQTPAESVYVTQQLERIYAPYPEIRSVSYRSALTNKPFHIRTDFGSRGSISDLEDAGFAHGQEQRLTFFEVSHVQRERRLRVYRSFIDIASRTPIGVTSFDVLDAQIRSRVSALTTSQLSSIYVFIQDEPQLLFASQETDETELDWLGSLKEETYGMPGVTKGAILRPEGTYIYYRDVSYELPLTLVKFIPQAVIDEARAAALERSLTIQMGAVVLVGLMAAFLSYIILQRVERILKHIKKLQMGDFRLKEPKRKKAPDELDLLEERFLEMAVKLDQLWNKQYRHQLELSHARLKMLQAQINPHFFYNTLQSIGTLAIKNNAREVSDRLAEFGALFRYSMDIDTEIVELKEELDHVAHYASLQMGRFKNKLTYSESCPPEAYTIRVPKMILQPLVENSIVHGLEKGTGYGEIRVEIECLEPGFLIRVIDNGKGFAPEEMQAIGRRDAAPAPIEERRGIGLTNVLTRLQLYYGDAFDWDIQSEAYRRTVVTLRIQRDGGAPNEAADRG